MSTSTGTKAKPKQAKSQQLIALQQRIQQLVKQNFEQSITIKKLTSQLSTLKQFQLFQSTQYQKSTHQSAQSIQKMQLIRAAQQEYLTKLRLKKQQLQIDNGCLVYKLQKLNKDYDQYVRMTRQQMDQMKRYYETEMKRHQQTSAEYQQAIDQRKQYISLNENLQTQLQQSLQHFTHIIADKDRQKLQTVDFMKKDMYQKAKQMKSTLLTMRRQQMETNARLTVLQNQQLLQELQYQSKHTEKILKKNQLLQKEIIQLKKQLQIEKEINSQLAKRTTLAKKIILNSKINDSSNGNAKINDGNLQQKGGDYQPPSSQSIQTLKKTLDNKQNLIVMLGSQLTKQSKSLQRTKGQLQNFKLLYEQIKPKYQAYLNSQNDLKIIMVRYLKNTLQGQQAQQNTVRDGEEKQNQQTPIKYDITRLKDIPVQQWTKSDIQITIKMLLTFIKPYFTMKHMKAKYFKYSNNIQQGKIKYKQQQQKLRSFQLLQLQKNKSKSKHNINYKLLAKGRKSLSTFQLISDSYNDNDKCQQQKGEQNQQHYSHTQSANISPQKKKKQFTLNSILQDIKQKSAKSKSKHKQRSQSKNIKKSQSQHCLNINIKQKVNKFSSGQQQQEESSMNINNGTSNNKLQTINGHKRQHSSHQATIQFNPDNFIKTKQPNNKLIKSNYRQWGQKINLRPRGSFIVDKKIQ